MTRCDWAKTEIYETYHDTEWGVPVHDDRLLFEFLILEGAQAGLSWITILKKRDAYRRAFHNFDAAKVAAYTAKDTARLLADAGIVRNRLKIASAVENAKAFSRRAIRVPAHSTTTSGVSSTAPPSRIAAARSRKFPPPPRSPTP